MGGMPLFPSLGRTIGSAFRGTRVLARGSVSGGRWVTRRVGRVREKGAGGEPGMVRLFDLHAVSCAGDTLIAIGLAGTIFFNAPLGEARSKVALYLLVTMVPFALLAPVVGPLLDHFRHGRRYALAATMLGRAFLAWMISDYIHGFGLYPAAFGVLALSRAYGVARSAAVPRLLPEKLGLSQAGARASVYGTIAGAVVAPLGLAAFWFGPQWPLRVASVIFLVGMVIALRLPPRADSDPPETVPRAWQILGFRRGKGERVLAGRLVLAALIGSASLRALYGFLLLFLAFAIKAGDLTTVVFGRDLGDEVALGLVGAALATGTFLATAIGTRLRIHHPLALQSSGLVIVAGVAVLATIKFSLLMVALLCLVSAVMSGIAKLAVDASIQERVRERMRASAFAHSETVLMLAFVAGGAVGLIPFDGRVGIGVVAGVGVLAAARAVVVAGQLRAERLHGRPVADGEEQSAAPDPATQPDADRAAGDPDPTDPKARKDPDRPAPERGASGIRRMFIRKKAGAREPAKTAADGPTPPRLDKPLRTPTQSGGDRPATPVERPEATAPPGYHIYRPSTAVPRPGSGDDETSRESRGPA
ncbi:MFS transporter [Polymorphospora rubra]|uniref:MFS transporter n=1 Tax=Polymorphospora rubra TaxID=338584 RepID=UPI003F4CE792